MKKVFLLIAIICFFSSSTLHSAEYCHYTNGVSGLKAATIPPPGEYYLQYHNFYHADKLMNQKGNHSNLNFNLTVYAHVHRFVWITEKKILGADFGFDVAVPFVYQNLKIDDLSISDSMFGLSDICIEPFILAWHKDRYDLVAGFGGFVPSGKYNPHNPASVGKDRYTGMLGAGATYYFDKKRTWSFSVLSRFETHTEERKSRVRPGNDFHFEWGMGKTIPGKWIWEMGAVGYCQWQVTDDKGIHATSLGARDRVFAAGPEISVFIPSCKLNIALRNNWEFKAHDRPKGTMTSLVFTKIF